METLDELHTAGSPSATSTTPPAKTTEPSAGKLSYEERKEQAKLRRKGGNAGVQACEKQVMKLEEEKAALEAQLATPEGAADTKLFEIYGKLQQALAEAETAWETAIEALEAFEEFIEVQRNSQ